MTTELEKNFNYYLKNQDKLIREFENKFLVIKDCKVVNKFTYEFEAVKYAEENLEPKTFLIFSEIFTFSEIINSTRSER